MDTVACERPESGESTGSRVHTQRAREGLGGGGKGDRGGEATLGTKADSTDTSHPLRGSAVSGPLGYILTYLCRAASSTLLSHSSLRELLTESRSSRNIKHTKQQ